jgi:hypothetical protein
MAPATFDGVNLLITLPAPTGGFLTVDVQEDIYSDWKVWVKDSGGHQFPPAFDTTGGDPIPGSQFISGSYFLRNDLGWRIQTTDADQEVTIIGNLYPRDEAFDTFLPRPTRTTSFNLNLTANPRDLSSSDVERIRKHLLNRQYTDPVTNRIDDYDDDDTVLGSADLFEDDGVTPWDGTGPIRRRNKYSDQ